METYDYLALYRVFSRVTKEQMGLRLIELYGNGKAPEPPYIAFDIISPRIPNNYLEDDRVFEAVVSFTVYAKDKLEALNTVNKLRVVIDNQTSQDIYAKENISVVEKMQTQTRYVDETTNYAYMFGFDMRLRLVETYQEDTSVIEEINLKEN
ncbi:phage neck terminator protein [Ligilactobacillus equi]|uniref:Phage neck terminator protein gp12-like domain-containing protein n=1 Tax=Ligilactobacillus equi DSM 15833 = JCM 10991 TaxID=1423740 RepID=A0A0R1TMA1_9LACO|nr:hypothetical protein [Ligilactobacillus equi]KRL81806.1 hypothetical protein FC36_GL001401 [Ligilactobacillus equi DSM 15833 = JCM 10991]